MYYKKNNISWLEYEAKGIVSIINEQLKGVNSS